MAQSSRSNRKVLVLPGDGIGPEIMREVMRLFEFFDRRNMVRFDVAEGLIDRVGSIKHSARFLQIVFAPLQHT